MTVARQISTQRQEVSKIHILITWIFACVVTITALGMAAVAGWDRGGNEIDRALLVASSMSICVGAHLVPALSRHRGAWILWGVCLIGTVYGHVTFFVNSNIRAGLAREQTSIQVAGTEKQLYAVREALSKIRARPVTEVAAELSLESKWKKRRALSLELSEAERAAHLRDEMVRLSAIASEALVTAAENPVTSKVAGVTGSNADSTELLIAIGASVILELLGALLWWEILMRNSSPQRQSGYPQISNDPIGELRDAISNGRCKPTVAEIRAFLGCGQAKAMELRRQLTALHSPKGEISTLNST